MLNFRNMIVDDTYKYSANFKHTYASYLRILMQFQNSEITAYDALCTYDNTSKPRVSLLMDLTTT